MALAHARVSLVISHEDINDWIDANVPTASTAKNYKQRINPIIKLIDSDNIFPSIKNKDVLKKIMEKGGAASTIKGATQVFLKLIKDYPGLLEAVGEKIYETYNKFFMEANGDMQNGYIQKVVEKDEKDEIESYSEIKKKIEARFPAGSDERLYTYLYEHVPVRDNLAEVYIVPNVFDTHDKSKNYYVLSTKTIVINKYKKEGKYGMLKFKLPKEIYKLIDTTKEKIFNHGERLTGWVHNMLKEIGIEGGVNVFRHAFISEKLEGENIKDPEKRKELFDKMGHSPAVQLQYIRPLKKEA